MSIINDALKKAEKEKQASQNKLGQFMNKVDGMKLQKVASKRWLVWAGLGIICLLGVILANNSFKGPVQPGVVQKEASSRAFGMRKIDIELPRRASDLNLSGILYDQEKPMAIINKRVVAKGAFVSGAEILEIQPNYIRVSFKGKELTLKVK
ncbi:MAG: hypothetical protein ISS43_01415 [Candidatus Omnitrophica bacterium]|nr:hypothetical protein [Candidatus Omnitrophota bacterium]